MSDVQEPAGNSRLHRILALVRKYGRISVKDLSRTFGVSEVIIRSDLNELAQQGLITRTFGGAIDVPAVRRSEESQAPDTARDLAGYGYQFGRVAAQLICEGDVIYIDSSDETRTMLPFIRNKKRIKVITSSLLAAYELATSTDLEIVVVGGAVAGRTLTIEADFQSNPMLARTNISKAFVGALGLSEAEGFTDSGGLEAAFKKEVVGRAKQVVVLIKSERWNRVSSATFARIDDVDVVVTDKEASSEMINFCKASDARVLSEEAEGAQRKDSGRYPYFDGLREYATDQIEYPDAPGRGRTLAFCNGCRSQGFGSLLEASIVEQALLAGFSRSDLIILDNDFNAERGLENADEVLKRKPDVFVEFQVDIKINNVIAHKFEKAAIPIVAVEIPIPSAPFVGLNNWKVAVMAGEYCCDRIRERWGDSPAIDLVVLMQMPVCGEPTMLRIEGFEDALIDEFGDDIQSKTVRADCGMGQPIESERAMAQILDTYPQARRMVITAIDEELMNGAIRSLRKMDRWERDELILVTYDCGTMGRRLLREGLIDAAVASFPENYGQYIIPAACALLANEPVPAYTYVRNELITKDNIDKYYP